MLMMSWASWRIVCTQVVKVSVVVVMLRGCQLQGLLSIGFGG
jgi:hypothetical protein